MKRKVIIATLALFVLIAGVVSAASIWGTYKGNDIIRLTVGGDPVKVSDVPVISYNNRTMIPIYLLQQAGISYTWDQKNKTVDILPQPKNNNMYNDQDIANIRIWSSCADYIQKLETYGSDYNSIIGQLTTLLLSMYAFSDVQDKSAATNSAIQIGNNMKGNLNRYFNVFNTNSKVVHNFYRNIGQSEKNLTYIETSFDSTAKYITDAYDYVSNYIAYGNKSDFDFAISSLNTATYNLNNAVSAARTEFDMFQTSIINY